MSDPKIDDAARDARRAETSALAGLLFAVAGTPLALLGPLEIVRLTPLTRWALAGSASALLMIAALTIMVRPAVGRTLATLAIVTTGFAFLPTWMARPAATLVGLLLLVLGLRLLWGTGAARGLADDQDGFSETGHLRGAVSGALGCWVLWVAMDAPGAMYLAAPVRWAGFVALSFGAWRASRRLGTQMLRSCLVLSAYALVGATIFYLRERIFLVATLPVALAIATGLSLRRRRAVIMGQETWWEPLLGHPERLFVGTFAALSILGAVALSLPISTTGDDPLSGLDAIFTSTSAVCVTGLITIDTPLDLSAFGQVIVLVLIQVGGLGIMTFSTAILWALGGRMSLRHEGAVASLISTRDRGRLFATAQRIVVFTLVTEAVGAAVLMTLFLLEGDSWGMAAWRGVFTSISAFCNAGFALQSDSLIPYQTAPLILHTVGTLIILGGLSPLAVFAIVPLARRCVVPILAQAKLALAAAGVLLVGGFLFMLAFEWDASLAGLSLQDKLHNAWFQSVTLRTAGFNSVDLTVIQPATLTLTLIWMFIGGSPGSTAGGVKTTTIAVLVLSVIQSIRGRASLEVFGKLIPERTRGRAAAIIAVAASTGVMALVAIQLTQGMSNRLAVFEVFSALGTVGLSIGGTGQLDGVGKIIIIICMFVGRVGGLSLLMFLSARTYVPRVGRPEEEVDVG